MMVVPSAFSLLKSCMISSAWLEWRLPVGSSARISFGLGDDGARDADQLLLAAGELARIKILFSDDLKAIERVGDQRGALRFAVAAIGERDVEILVNRQVIEQVVVLEDEADLLVAQVVRSFGFRRWIGGFIEEIFAGPAEVVHA